MGDSNSSELVRRLLTDRIVAYHPLLARALGKGVATAVFLSQLLYWWQRLKDGDLGVYRSLDQWQAETGLSRRELMTARRHLRDLAVIEENITGYPPRVYCQIDFDRLERLLLESHALNSRESRASIRANRANCNKESEDYEKEYDDDDAGTRAHVKDYEQALEALASALRLSWVRLFGEDQARAATGAIEQSARALAGIPVEWVQEAANRTALNGGRTGKYLLSILEAWKKAGKVTSADARSSPARHAGRHAYSDPSCKCGCNEEAR